MPCSEGHWALGRLPAAIEPQFTTLLLSAFPCSPKLSKKCLSCSHRWFWEGMEEWNSFPKLRSTHPWQSQGAEVVRVLAPMFPMRWSFPNFSSAASHPFAPFGALSAAFSFPPSMSSLKISTSFALEQPADCLPFSSLFHVLGASRKERGHPEYGWECI